MLCLSIWIFIYIVMVLWRMLIEFLLRLHCRLHLGMLMRIGKTGNLFTGSGSTNCIAIIEINMKVKKKLQREIPHDAWAYTQRIPCPTREKLPFSVHCCLIQNWEEMEPESCLPTGEEIVKKKISLFTKKSKIMALAGKWMDTENVIINVVSQT